MIFQFTTLLFSGGFFNMLNDGGPIFMYPNFLILLTCIGLSIFALLKGDPTRKWQEILKSLSLFALVWGFTGFMIGMFGALDAISNSDGDIATPVLAGGLRIGLLSPLFGSIIFLVARLGILLLIFKKNSFN